MLRSGEKKLRGPRGAGRASGNRDCSIPTNWIAAPLLHGVVQQRVVAAASRLLLVDEAYRAYPPPPQGNYMHRDFR